jgi:hypothetical protein
MKIFVFTIIIMSSLSAFCQQKQYIVWDDARINDKIALTITLSEFEKRYKIADSITTPKPDEVCGTRNAVNAKLLYYKGIEYLLDDGKLNFRSIDFSKRRGMYFAIKDDWFDHTTTLKSFRKSFPEESDLIEDYAADNGEEFDRIIVLPEDLTLNYAWFFYFKDDKLHSIECVFTCK